MESSFGNYRDILDYEYDIEEQVGNVMEKVDDLGSSDYQGKTLSMKTTSSQE